jgi:aarF domain-containing kinase
MHPNVEDDIDADLDLMRLSVRIIARVPFLSNLKWLNLEGVVEELACMLKIQLDLRTEASNLERFNANFKNNEYVVFPKVRVHTCTGCNVVCFY